MDNCRELFGHHPDFVINNVFCECNCVDGLASTNHKFSLEVYVLEKILKDISHLVALDNMGNISSRELRF